VRAGCPRSQDTQASPFQLHAELNRSRPVVLVIEHSEA